MGRKWGRWGWFLLAVSPAIVPLSLILNYGFDFHYFDEWMPDMAGVLLKAHAHQLTLGDILAQHNEHRPAVMRLIWVAIDPITHWNNVGDLLAAWLLVAATSVLVWLLIRRTQPEGGRLPLWFLCNILIFSVAQIENWLWGMGLQNFSPAFFMLATFWVAGSRLRIWGRLVLCLGLATLATFSSGNGILAWPLGGILLLWGDDSDLRKAKKWVAAVWLAACGLVVFLYYHGYHSPGFEGNPYARTFSAITLWTLAFMGSPFPHFGNVQGAVDRMVPGAVVLAVVFASAIYFCKLWKCGRQETCDRILPWLMVAGFGVLSGLSAAFFRAGFGPEQAVSARYVSAAIYTPIALVNLVAIFFGAGRWKPAPAVLAAALVLSQVIIIPSAIDAARAREEKLRLGKGALLLVNILPDDPESAQYGPYWPAELVATANALSAMGDLHPRLIASDQAAQIARQNNGDRRDAEGEIDSFTEDAKGSMVAGGWAYFPQLGRSVSCVFLTYRDAEDRPIIFAAAKMGFDRPDLAGNLPLEATGRCGWQAIVDPGKIPQPIRATILEAWALDVETGLATPLDHGIPIRR